MNQTIDTILAHRSIRRFTSEPIQADVLSTLLDCAIAASSSSFIQCVSVIRVVDTDKRTQMAHLAGDQPYVASAAEFLVFCVDFHRHLQIHPEAQLGFTEQTLIGAVDAALMAQNCLLAAESLGLGGVYIGGIRNNPAEVAALLDMPKHVMPVFGLCLGYPDQNPESKPRLPQSLVIHQNSYQQELDRHQLAEYDEKVRQYYQSRTGGNKDMSWSEQITATLTKEARPFMKDFLTSKGFSTR
ncbi:oxygen-insensitive NADPH nitroreductase [Photobacterium sp. WH77]|uniref:oxygen-insensitive NADPH nitroreductase n=1 Tax=Photobacterium TaxID=657 RepID=UPI001C4451FF|nr:MULTISPECIES: oxygen-insensitive NADPH nitroreductase [Photobacterium]MBV7260940.1 oxygen-insensitive NADPH nitroreductase [Photobacterium sp. WH24]MCG2838601.1 oxygen-insensitive NADPH nitroreductase [Photobacterium sp. WH77]MCG2846178.1 oxygen-insensitive NADPH nitroreductase [Photobacterium sp. WH80]